MMTIGSYMMTKLLPMQKLEICRSSEDWWSPPHSREGEICWVGVPSYVRDPPSHAPLCIKENTRKKKKKK
jgi:hypothetical protein